MSVADGLKRLLHSAPEWPAVALHALRSQLTPGQRWTSALAIVLATLVIFAGLPTKSTVLPGSDRTRSADASDVGATTEKPDDGAVPVPPSASDREDLLVSDAVANPTSPGPSVQSPGTAPVPDRGASPDVAPPAVVALVRRDETRPGRDDASIAAAFLDQAGYDSELVALGPEASEDCHAALAQGSVILSSTGLEPDLRRCLADGGATVIAFDAAGDVPATAAGGTFVSTRRGLVESVADLGRWGQASGTLAGRIGLVGGVSERVAIEQAAGRLRALGVDLRAIAYPDESDPTTITSELRRFATEGIDTVVFAAPMTVQRQWAAQQAVLSPDVRSVVSDAFDAIVDESYPPSFDGALAHTSLRVPWFERTEGETIVQATCRETWEATAGAMLPGETVPVFAWCQHVAMAGAALRGGTPSSFAEAIRSQRVASPLTSDLGPLPSNRYGPVADVSLVWRAACACWQPVDGFRPR